jgi:ankyrin repeat protein
MNNRQLMEAVTSSTPAEVHRLLEAGAKVNVKDDIGESPLHLAVRRGSLEIVEELLAANANVNAKSKNGSTPLHLLVENSEYRNLEIARRLIENGADVNAKRRKTSWSMLHWAASGNDTELTELLLSAGADVDEQANSNRETPLHVTKAVAVADLLLDAGANVNAGDKEGFSPLFRAIASPTKDNPISQITELIDRLVEAGADIHTQAGNGWSLLDAAISAGAPEVGRKLIDAGVDVSVSHKSLGTPLHHAAAVGSSTFIDLLLQSDAPINSQNAPRQWTPLHYAVRHEDSAPAQRLINAGANVNLQSQYGERPLDLARTDEIRQLLVDAGAEG